MKVMRIKISNFRGIECQEIAANGKHVRLKGPNGVGKTSAAKAFLWALAGRGTDQPVREGAESAEVQIDVGDFVFTRTAFADGRSSKFVGRGKGGKSLPSSPAAFVKSLVGSGLALDPLALFAMKDEDQVATILRAFKVDVSEQDKQEQELYAERTRVNASKRSADERVKELEAKGAKQDAPAPEDPAAVQAALTKAEQAKAEHERRARRVESAKERQRLAKAAVARALEEEELADIAVAQAEEEPADLPVAESVLAEARAKFASLNERNRAGELGAELREKLASSELLRGESEHLTKAIEEVQKLRASKIATAAVNAGLDGLQFSPDKRGVNFGGVRLAELNATTRVKVGLRIARAEQPEIGTFVVDQASELDDASTRELLEWGDKIDGQLVLACVERDGNGLEIEVFDAEEEINGGR